MESQIEATDFDYGSGELCLDFSNTLDWHTSDHPGERLPDFNALVSWGEGAGILASEKASGLRQLASQQPDQAKAVYERAIQLREAVYGIFSHRYYQDPIQPADLQFLNATLSRSLPHLQVVSSPEGYIWEWRDDSGELDQVTWPVVRSAAELLTSDYLERVRVCEDDRGCGYLFVDNTRNHSRRWCSMESCGNRAKARRHYARQRISP